MPIQLSGSLVITGSITTTGVITMSGSIASASYSSTSDLLQGTGSVGFTTTASFNAVSASQQQISSSYISLSGSYNTFSGSASTRITVDSASLLQVSSSQQQISASYIALSASYNVFSGSASTRTTQIEQVYATTGSNSFRATQSITGSLTVTGQIIAQTINVQQVTSSIVYSSGSNIFGCDLNSRQTFTGSVLITGSLTIAGASSATSYSGTTIYGSTAVCSAVGKFTTCIDAGSGTFSGGVTATSFNLGNGQYLRLTRNSGTLQYDAFGIVVGTDNTRIISTNDFDIVNGGLVSQFKIAGSGVATFACQVNAESFYTNDTRYISNQIMSGYNANSEDSDIWINYTGYLGGTTRFRDFRIGNGKQGQIALFDGSTGAASFACSVGVGTTLSVTGATSLSCRLSVGASDQSYASIFVGGDITTGANQYAIILDPQLSGTSNSYAVFANARIKANTAVTNAFGIYIPSAEKISGATITNNYALYIANQTSGATLNYSIYSSGGANYFGGCVGIGTTTPTYKLDVYTTGGTSALRINSDATQNSQIRLDEASTVKFAITYVPSDATARMYFAGHGSDLITLKGSNVGIGTVVPNARLDLGTSYGSNGEKLLIYNDDSSTALAGTKVGFYMDRFSESNSVTFVFPQAGGSTSRYHIAYKNTSNTTLVDLAYLNYNSTSWVFPSDERMKNIEGIIPNALDKIKDLRAVYYTQKRDPEQKRKVGLLAQDLLKVLPEIVDVPDTEFDGEGNQRYMSVALADTIPLLVKAIQEQQCTINTLKTCLGIS